MLTTRSIYYGISFTPKQPIPNKEKYEVVNTFMKPIIYDIKNSLKLLLEPDIASGQTVEIVKSFPKVNFEMGDANHE